MLKFCFCAQAVLGILPELVFVLKSRKKVLDWKEDDLEVDR